MQRRDCHAEEERADRAGVCVCLLRHGELLHSLISKTLGGCSLQAAMISKAAGSECNSSQVGAMSRGPSIR